MTDGRIEYEVHWHDGEWKYRVNAYLTVVLPTGTYGVSTHPSTPRTDLPTFDSEEEAWAWVETVGAVPDETPV